MNGQVFLYTRKDFQKKKWWMRLNIPGKKGYVVRSTFCYELHEAQRIAEAAFFELKDKVARKLPIGRSGFKKIFNKFMVEMETGHRLSIHRLRVFRHFGGYWSEYFGSRLVEGFDTEDLEQYRIWREIYWTTGAGQDRDKPANAAPRPSRNTMVMDRQCMKQFLRWCKQKKLIDIVPDYHLPQPRPEERTHRRATFTVKEWGVLTRQLRSYAQGPEAKQQDKVHRWQRQMIRHAVLIIANTGLRPQEAAQLRWFQVSFKKNTKHPDLFDTLIHIPPHSKTGERTAVGTQDCHEYFTRLKALSPHTEDNDYVFCSFWGEKQTHWGKHFKDLLRDWKMLTDGFGRNRTIYSLRHFFITQRLEYLPVHLVAHICGTSIYNIEKHYYHATIEKDASMIGAKPRHHRVAEEALDYDAN